MGTLALPLTLTLTLTLTKVDQQGLVTWVEHIDGRGKVPQ